MDFMGIFLELLYAACVVAAASFIVFLFAQSALEEGGKRTSGTDDAAKKRAVLAAQEHEIEQQFHVGDGGLVKELFVVDDHEGETEEGEKKINEQISPVTVRDRAIFGEAILDGFDGEESVGGGDDFQGDESFDMLKGFAIKIKTEGQVDESDWITGYREIEIESGEEGCGVSEREGIVAKGSDNIVKNNDEDDEITLSDDWEGIERTELEKYFGAAVVFANSKDNADRIDSDVKMQLYGLHQIATEGQCHAPQPMALKVAARAKWNAWQRLGNMSREEAMEQYISLLSSSIPGWKDL